jgi:5'-3' exonuclease
MKSHLIIDGNNLVHRAFWVAKSNPHIDHKQLTLRSLKNYHEQFKPTDIWCAWDLRKSKEPSFRSGISSEYKQTRDSDYNEQVHVETQIIADLFESMGITNIYPQRGEADDIIFWLCSTLEGKKNVISVDTDMLQLISEDTSIYCPIKKIKYTPESFYDKFKFNHTEYIRYKALIGDKADNIEGLYNVGHKRALNIINNDTELDTEQKNILAKNMSLMDLNNLHLSEWVDEYGHYNQQVVEPKSDFKRFIQICEENSMRAIVKDQSAWHSTFFIKGVMNDIFTKLFS